MTIADRLKAQRGDATTYPEPPREKAYHGLAGDVVRRMEPHSEADPVALLVTFLLSFGNAAGRGPGMQIEGDFHATNENAALVGDSAKGRKGTSRGRVEQLFRLADPEWARKGQRSGMVSGEGLVWAVRDPIYSFRRAKTKPEKEEANEDGMLYELTDPGIEDKRLMVTEGEFASMLAVTKREGNTLSPTVRDLFDREVVQTLAKNSPACATGALVSIVGHITTDELRRELTDTAKANGLANRFLFFMVKRSKLLPFGGELRDEDLHDLANRVAVVLAEARYAGSLTWSDDAAAHWESVYGDLSDGKSGLFGAVIARGETHCVRLAVIYALLDGSRVIELDHIRAALALWDYSERSAAYVVGGTIGDPIADRALAAIRAAGEDGVTRNELREDTFQRHVDAGRLDVALQALLERGLIRKVEESTGGRPTTRYYAV